jgi:hypothetical protein
MPNIKGWAVLFGVSVLTTTFLMSILQDFFSGLSVLSQFGIVTGITVATLVVINVKLHQYLQKRDSSLRIF